MNICVCFKVIPDLEKVLPDDWLTFEKEPDLSYTGHIIGCYDESALEMALIIKENNPSSLCTALTLGFLPPHIGKKLYAAGFDNVVCLLCEEREFSQKEVAIKLGEYIKTNTFDLIFTGNQSAYGDSGHVPAYLASNLEIPFISHVQLCTLDTNILKFHQETDEGQWELEIKALCVASVFNSTLLLRLPTFIEQMNAGKKKVLEIPIAHIDSSKPLLLPQKQKKSFTLENIHDAAAYIIQAIERSKI